MLLSPLFIILFSCSLLNSLGAQSKTVEIVPEFNLKSTAYVSQEVPFASAQKETEFIGLSCYHLDRDELEIYYRIKENNHWSAWTIMNKQHEFVDSNRSAYQAKPIKKFFDYIQFKTNKKPKTSLSFRFFLAAESTKTFGLDPLKTLHNRSINCEIADVCDRMCWCPTCPIDITPQLTDPTHLIVHHSAGNNVSNNFAQVVEFIWDLHVNTNGWDDIGYNWLIDPNGILYQGRPDNYQGAHFSCINENTVGICVIGDYSSQQPSEEAMNTLVNHLA